MSRASLGIDYKLLRRIPYLILLVKYGINDKDYVTINLTRLANDIGTTPQNVFKIINRLAEEGGLIIKSAVSGQLAIKFTQRASEALQFVIDTIRHYLDERLVIRLVGNVVSGLGEGGFYMSLDGYVKQFVEKLGFKPYPGTLNIRLKPEYVKYRLYLDALPGIYIEGFSNGVRTYGGVKCFRAMIQGLPGAVLLIERTHHGPDTIEVISPYKLRDKLGLKDGDEIEVLVTL
ncbi:CTP-dependent riboflavin kinase [Vulcanisaeta distributa]|uniref:CTP-dependent riboflavin kinase n=1 Tax=Vulcanisaeta distributa TaxID=164451 RepID=UPI001FB48B80|nr:CTP-dependent riboflavin kinase [Vulcanisaeta distributa]